MRNQSLNDRILNVLELAGRPLTASEICRALPGNVERSDLSCRLSKLIARGDVAADSAPRKALTGPRCIKEYRFIPSKQGKLLNNKNHSQEWNIFQLLPQTQ